jgi:SUMO ligase MMS21 Smc5/6 complex component
MSDKRSKGIEVIVGVCSVVLDLEDGQWRKCEPISWNSQHWPILFHRTAWRYEQDLVEKIRRYVCGTSRRMSCDLMRQRRRHVRVTDLLILAQRQGTKDHHESLPAFHHPNVVYLRLKL